MICSASNPSSEGLGRCAYLEPIGIFQAFSGPHRVYDEAHGFFIHGPGRKGSDGCIVPVPKARFYELLDAIDVCTGQLILRSVL
jgi:hypothetical protein